MRDGRDRATHIIAGAALTAFGTWLKWIRRAEAEDVDVRRRLDLSVNVISDCGERFVHATHSRGSWQLADACAHGPGLPAQTIVHHRRELHIGIVEREAASANRRFCSSYFQMAHTALADSAAARSGKTFKLFHRPDPADVKGDPYRE